VSDAAWSSWRPKVFHQIGTPVKEKFKVDHVEAALRATGGIVTAAAKALKQAYGSCSPASVRNYIKRHPSLQRVVEDVVEQNLDLAEHKLLKNVEAGREASIFFYLKTKGKERGYVERFGYVDKNDKPVDGPTYVIVLPDNGRDPPEGK
jgi:hypothetical protein